MMFSDCVDYNMCLGGVEKGAHDQQYLTKTLLAGLPPVERRVAEMRSGKAPTGVTPNENRQALEQSQVTLCHPKAQGAETTQVINLHRSLFVSNAGLEVGKKLKSSPQSSHYWPHIDEKESAPWSQMEKFPLCEG